MKLMMYRPEMAGDLTDAFNRGVRQVPHCYPVGTAELAAALTPAAGEGVTGGRLHSESVRVAIDSGRIAGFVHSAVGWREKGGPERGILRFLWYERGCRAAGQALLEAAEAGLLERGLRRIEAVHCDDAYRFYHVPYGHLSVRLEHVQALLRMNGYDWCEGEVILDWPGYEPAGSGSDAGGVSFDVKWKEGRGRLPNLETAAFEGDERVGHCECVSCGEFNGDERAQDWLFVTGLFLAERVRGRGLGRRLLRRSLAQMHEAGYRNAAISTDWQNARALLFYSNDGFRMTDWTYCWRREWPGP